MTRRSGGRKSKVAIRSAPLTEEKKPIHPGESGGHYKPFKDDDMEAVVENIYRVLEEIGFNQATPHCVKTCTEYGAILGEDGRLRMPREIVNKAIESSKQRGFMAASRVIPHQDAEGAEIYMLRVDQDILKKRNYSIFSMYDWSTSNKAGLGK